MENAFVYDGLRTPFGRYAGALATIRPDDLMARTVTTLLARSSFDGGNVEDVIIGCCNQAGEDCRNVGRRAALLAGLPVHVAGSTVHRQCGSGMNAVLDAARCCEAGMGELFVAGGVESMSRGPYVISKGAKPFDRGVKMYDSTAGSRFPNPALTKRYGDHTMPETADHIGRDLGIDREESDAFALASQQKYAAAKSRGFYDGELMDLEVPGQRRDETVTVSADEHPRPDSNAEALKRLRALNKDGVVTAGNSSGINDGASALIIGTAAAGHRAGAKPVAQIVAGAVSGVEPRVMGLGPVPASKKALNRSGLTLSDMDVIEINEAFATQVLGCTRQMGIDGDDSRLNPNGGAIAIGHPLGASGGRLILTAIRQLRATGGRYALVTLCIGVGQGIATIIENLDST